jgi:excisionase family DNA binding protein
LTEKLINTNELAELLGVSVMTISRLRSKGMPYMKLGGSVRFDPSKIKEWMQSREEVKEG